MVIKAQKEMPIKLDAIDKKIFYYLSVNYRMQRKNLANLIRISPQRLNHRIKQLEKTILEPFVCLNFPLLNFSSYLVLYEKLNEEEIELISASGNVYYLLQLVGDYQYLAIIFSEDIIGFCSKKTPNLIPSIFPLSGYFPDTWNGFDVPLLRKNPKTRINLRLDSKDYKILLSLCNEPNVSLLDLSEKLNISRPTIIKKIKLMEESNVIQRYKFALNVPKIGLLVYFIHLSCVSQEINSLKELIQESKYSGFLFQSNNHLFFSYIVFNSEQLFDFLDVIEKNGNSKIEVSQNTGNYIVEPVPRYVKELIQARIKN